MIEDLKDIVVLFLTKADLEELTERMAKSGLLRNRSQIATGSQRHRDPRFLPYAFTEHGAIMAANVLNSPRAVQMSVFVVRAFVRLRQMVIAHKEMAAKLADLEHRIASHDEQIQAIFDAIRQLMTPPDPKKRKIGFLVKEKATKYGRSEFTSGVKRFDPQKKAATRKDC
ncbi:MAG: hypothetical protein HY695_22490 [Deltaproteobacteria bacterium]|nr:hypothetical protein [Deltaproteobacteria bacterium]